MKTVIHIPHDGNVHPETLMRTVCVPKEEYLRYHDIMRDAEVRQLVPESLLNGAELIEFSISRLLCDVERFIGEGEIMENYGMGYCYARAFDGRLIKILDEELLADTRIYYDEHHERLDAAVSDEKELLFIDLHSFSREIVPPDFIKPDAPVPDVCLGADSKFTPLELITAAERAFRSEGFSIDVNYPYSGTMVPNAVMNGKTDVRLSSIMIEVNKRCYLDENDMIIPTAADRIKRAINGLVGAWTENR